MHTCVMLILRVLEFTCTYMASSSSSSSTLCYLLLYEIEQWSAGIVSPCSRLSWEVLAFSTFCGVGPANTAVGAQNLIIVMCFATHEFIMDSVSNFVVWCSVETGQRKIKSSITWYILHGTCMKRSYNCNTCSKCQLGTQNYISRELAIDLMVQSLTTVWWNEICVNDCYKLEIKPPSPHWKYCLSVCGLINCANDLCRVS